ncbi:phosphopantetheinyl transferase PptB [Aspergillus eucalypticola CBS 122712]|uniref:Phosphopantetheinyl transferase PptB n=1 Tax=Aspergillus eucalypticola (strain CBS 122712 / IBT 29274) TaxID=1448314 RepID=A0A317VVY7_ASPEC|nr:phosphopantetheinyl transferase PptB [Aspergillus eucalypticola CBS 122712]PWY77925.1 phosphopantetheinyl transferase PptB [Aspergillus eucalypticola CBS 122712]
MKPTPFPFALNIGTDIVHLPRITRLLARPNYLTRFTHRILHAREQQDFRTRFSLPPLSSSSAAQTPTTPSISISPDMTRWLAGRFAAKEAARKAAPRGAAHISWKDVVVTVAEEGGRPEVVYLDGDGDEAGRVGKLSISHDGEYVVAMVVAAG